MRAFCLMPALALLFSSVALAAPASDASEASSSTPAGPEPRPYEDPVASALEVQSGGLTSDEVAARASANAPMLRAQAARIRSAEAGLQQSKIGFIPQVKGTAGYTRLSPTASDFGGAIVAAGTPGAVVAAPCLPDSGAPPGVSCLYDQDGNPVGAAEFGFDNPLNQFSLQATLGVPFSDYILSLTPAKRSAEEQVKASRYAREAELLQIESDARQAYYRWLGAVAGVAVAQQSLENTQARLVDAQNAFEAGAASKADVMRLEAAVASVTASLDRAREYERLAAQQISLIMGEQNSSPDFRVGESVLGPLPPLPSEDLDTLIERAHAKRPELKAMQHSIGGMDEGIKATRANYYPRLDGFAEATYANPNTRFFPLTSEWRGSWSAGVTLTWVMNQTLVTKARVAQLEADRADLDAQYENAKRGIALEVSSAHADLRAARAIALQQDKAEAASAEAYRVAVDLYRNGEATTTDVMDAESERANATLQRVNAHIEVHSAQTRLQFATGQLVPVGEAATQP